MHKGPPLGLRASFNFHVAWEPKNFLCESHRWTVAGSKSPSGDEGELTRQQRWACSTVEDIAKILGLCSPWDCCGDELIRRITTLTKLSYSTQRLPWQIPRVGTPRMEPAQLYKPQVQWAAYTRSPRRKSGGKGTPCGLNVTWDMYPTSM